MFLVNSLNCETQSCNCFWNWLNKLWNCEVINDKSKGGRESCCLGSSAASLSVWLGNWAIRCNWPANAWNCWLNILNKPSIWRTNCARIESRKLLFCWYQVGFPKKLIKVNQINNIQRYEAKSNAKSLLKARLKVIEKSFK